MSDQNLFLPICLPILLLVILALAVIGMKARIRFANRLRNAYEDKERIDGWPKSYKSKQKLLLLISAISILGTLILGLLLITSIIGMSKIILLILVALILSTIISGIVILVDIERMIK